MKVSKTELVCSTDFQSRKETMGALLWQQLSVTMMEHGTKGPEKETRPSAETEIKEERPLSEAFWRRSYI